VSQDTDSSYDEIPKTNQTQQHERGDLTMQVNSLTSKFKKQFQVTVTKEQIALALNSYDPAIVPDEVGAKQQLSTEQVDGIVERLVKQGVLPDAALTGGAEPEAKATKAKKASKGRVPRGKALVWDPDEARVRNAADEAALEWMRAVIEADVEIKAQERSGDPFRPPFEVSNSGRGIVYCDPFSQYLERHEFSEYTPKGNDCNEIYAPHEKLSVWMANPGQSFQWRSNEILAKFERKLLELWCAKRNCRYCHLPLQGGLGDEVKQVLREERYLPDTPNVPKGKLFVYPESHPWCVSIIKETVQLEVELQNYSGDDPVATARRSDVYVDLVGRVAHKHEVDGVTPSTVISSLRAIRSVDRERIARVAS
jgi:uncharacterized protein (UPF0297 family)